MPRIAAFEAHSERYKAWFARHEAAYPSELLAVRALLPWSGRSLEMGVGSALRCSPGDSGGRRSLAAHADLGRCARHRGRGGDRRTSVIPAG
jgi:hypothetical protein